MAAQSLFCAQISLTRPSSVALQRPSLASVVGPQGRPEPRWVCIVRKPR
jgi:hypothetical protein